MRLPRTSEGRTEGRLAPLTLLITSFKDFILNPCPICLDEIENHTPHGTALRHMRQVRNLKSHTAVY